MQMTDLPFIQNAEAYLRLCYSELKKEHLLDSRLQNIRSEINKTGTYDLLDFELDYGTKVAWRNSNKCIGRLFWRNMEVFDRRSINNIDSIFDSLLEHIDFATNDGNIKSTITIFNNRQKIHVWNPQLLSFAGYKKDDGTIIGDPKQVEFTEKCVQLGWIPKMGQFDILPLVIQIEDKKPHWREIPKDIIKLVPIHHPEIESFSELNLKWYSTPIISNMILEVGGLKFEASPFNGWYMGTEIGARNLADESRYDMLPKVAKLLELDVKDKNSLWKDRALVELNRAVLYSFKKAGVKIVDHHSASKQFMEFTRKEAKEGRDLTADWAWIVPPISGSTMEVFHTEMDNTIKTPNYFYREEPWSF